MNYKETCEYLYGQMPMFEKQGASGYKEGLVNTLKLDDHFNHPHQNYRTIHVAGTNGKGSCAHTLAAILQMCGYKVGLYTSPHLVDFSERIRINGQPIDEDYVVDFVEKETGFFESLSPSLFEVVTAMAFKYGAEKKSLEDQGEKLRGGLGVGMGMVVIMGVVVIVRMVVIVGMVVIAITGTILSSIIQFFHRKLVKGGNR